MCLSVWEFVQKANTFAIGNYLQSFWLDVSITLLHNKCDAAAAIFHSHNRKKFLFKLSTLAIFISFTPEKYKQKFSVLKILFRSSEHWKLKTEEGNMKHIK